MTSLSSRRYSGRLRLRLSGLECRPHFTSVLIALFGLLPEAALNDGSQRRRHLRRQRERRFVQNRAGELECSASIERPLARCHFVEKDAERPDV